MSKYLKLDQESYNVFEKLNNKDTPAQEMIDSFLSYKFNRYKAKIGKILVVDFVLENAVRRIKGDVVVESELVTSDLLEP